MLGKHLLNHLLRNLSSQDAKVMAHDPHVNPEIIRAMGAEPVSLEEALKCDCVVLITDHKEYFDISPEMIEKSVFVCTRPILDPEKFRKEGVIFKGVGRP